MGIIHFVPLGIHLHSNHARYPRPPHQRRASRPDPPRPWKWHSHPNRCCCCAPSPTTLGYNHCHCKNQDPSYVYEHQKIVHVHVPLHSPRVGDSTASARGRIRGTRQQRPKAGPGPAGGDLARPSRRGSSRGPGLRVCVRDGVSSLISRWGRGREGERKRERDGVFWCLVVGLRSFRAQRCGFSCCVPVRSLYDVHAGYIIGLDICLCVMPSGRKVSSVFDNSKAHAKPSSPGTYANTCAGEELALAAVSTRTESSPPARAKPARAEVRAEKAVDNDGASQTDAEQNEFPDR